jgi:hypothetical protein
MVCPVICGWVARCSCLVAGGVGCAVGARVFGAERFWMPLGEMAWCLVVLWDGWERMVRE